MNKFLLPNPEIEDRKIVRIVLNDAETPTWIDPTGLAAVPLGYRGFARVSGNILEFGLEKIPAGGAGSVLPPAGGDTLDARTLPELQTIAARQGIKYTKDDDRVVLIQSIRAKAKK